MTAAFYTMINNNINAVPLSDYRRAKLGHGQARDALQYCCEALLIAALAAVGYAPELPLVIKTDKNGKPFLDKGPQFSLSHSGALILAAVSDMAIGADIQAPVDAEKALKLAGRFFTKEENAAVCKSPACFTALWTRKEAYLKYTGEGINAGLEHFSVLEAPGGLVFSDGMTGGLPYSICAHESCPPPRYIHI